MLILISDIVDFKLKTVTRDQESLYGMIKGLIHQEDITFVKHLCTQHIWAPKYMKYLLTDLKGEIDSNTIIARNFNSPLYR